MEKIKNIVQDYSRAATSYEIAFRPRKICCPDVIVSVYDSDACALAPRMREDVDPLDLWAYDYDILGEDEYNDVFGVDYNFRELFGDANAKVLVIWLTALSYEILSNREIKTVREFRLDNIGQYHEYYVVSRVRDLARRNHDSWEEDEHYDQEGDDNEEYISIPAEKFQVQKGTKEQLDRLYARESILISASVLGVDYELNGGDRWWREETAIEHFGCDDANVLLIVLA